MKSLLGLGALLALVVPGIAHAGVGTTAYMSHLSDGTAWWPSLDVRTKGWLVQIHALDLVGSLPNKYVDVGFDVTKNVVKKKVDEDIEGVVMPGLGARFYSADTRFSNPQFNVVVETRMGAEIKKGAGFGMYVVPMIGVGNVATGNFGVTYGGGLQVSAWVK